MYLLPSQLLSCIFPKILKAKENINEKILYDGTFLMRFRTPT